MKGITEGECESGVGLHLLWSMSIKYPAFPGRQTPYKKQLSARFGSTYTKFGMIQRRLAWPLSKDDMQIHEAFHIFEQNFGLCGRR